jgi:hypothetical protein
VCGASRQPARRACCASAPRARGQASRCVV